MFKRFCNCCEKPLPLRMKMKASESTAYEIEMTVQINKVPVKCAILAMVDCVADMSDLCSECGRKAITIAMQEPSKKTEKAKGKKDESPKPPKWARNKPKKKKTKKRKTT